MPMFKKLTVYAVSASLMLSGTLSGCVTASNSNSGFNVGPQLSSFFGKKEDHSQEANRARLDVIVPVFDPGLPKDTKEYEEKGIWPELRRAEANRFAVKLKNALEATGAFGAVRVTPDKTATGDLYVMGTIAESNGEDVEIDLVVADVSGNVWMDESYDHEVDSTFHENIRNKGKDPYDPVFEEAALDIVKELNSHKTAELNKITDLTDLRFGASFSQSAFSQHMAIENGKATLISMPSDEDPMLRRTRAIRVRDQLFVDRLQSRYQTFSAGMNDSYYMWQEQSLLEIEAERAAKRKATGQAVAGVLLLGLAALAGASASRSDDPNNQALATTGAVVAGVGGLSMLSESFQTSEEAKIHRDALAELGQSVDMDLAPRVVEFEDKTVELTGDAKEQFAQWRNFLQRVYALESTPNTQL